MRKTFVSLAVTICIVLSVFGNLFADEIKTGDIKIGDTVYDYEIRFVDMYAIASLRQTKKTTATGPSIESYSSNIDILSILAPDSSSNYTASLDTTLFKQAHYLHVYGNCTKISGLANLPHLEKIYIHNNANSYVTVDLTETSLRYLPAVIIENCNKDIVISMGFCSYKGTSSLFIPYSYGNDGLDYSFEDSTVIKSVDFEKGTKVIPEEAFYHCSNLSSVNIPAGVTAIEYNAFRKCSSLKTVTIPNSVRSIGFNAFTGTGLTDITYEGTINSWKGLVKELDSDGNKIGEALHLDGTLVHCSDGDLMIKKADGSSYAYSYKYVTVGWVHFGTGMWFYFKTDGSGNYLKNTMATIDGKTYGFNKTGFMIMGWAEFSGKWYYFNNSGVMVTGWLNNNNKWYYLNADGSMVTGWKQIDGKWYFFEGTGVMKTGWVGSGSTYYYMDTTGAMVTGWKQISGKWYYFKASGLMACNEWCDGYWLNADGSWTYPYKGSWRQNSKGWWFGDTSGWYAKSETVRINDKDYNFDANGYCTNP